eukprot:scaffold10508_cov180-Isochrysis_galbana.AAC.2
MAHASEDLGVLTIALLFPLPSYVCRCSKPPGRSACVQEAASRSNTMYPIGGWQLILCNVLEDLCQGVNNPISGNEWPQKQTTQKGGRVQ